MSIDKLSRLFSALGGSAQGYSSNNTTATKQAESSPQGTEAVNVASGFGRGEETADSARRARVEEIKSAVKAGSYKPDSKLVAESVARELFT